MEKPFRLGDSIAREKFSRGQPSASSSTLPPALDLEHELELALQDSKEASSTKSSTPKMKELGARRAKIFGWHDAYVFTKAMGEMMIDSLRGDVPVVIIRPSTIESTLNDPFSGWIQGIRMMDPIIIGYGKRQISCFPANPDCTLDIVPVDIVANTILATAAKHGSLPELKSSVINVYHVGTSVANPISFGDITKLVYQHFTTYPCTDPNNRPIKILPFKLVNSMEDFSATIRRDFIESIATSSAVGYSEHFNGILSPKQEIILKKLMHQVHRMANVYKPYTFYNGRFDVTNTKGLMEEMSQEEKKKFNLDLESIDWEHYIVNVHVSGLRRHVRKQG